MRDLITCLKAAAVGAIAMYYLDPDLGRRRRAELNDKMRSACDSFGQCVRNEGSHVAHRARRMASEVESSLTAAVVDDYTLVENIRARLGHLVSSPDAVDVSVNDGIASLAGHVLAAEHKLLITAVAAMPGIRSVADHLSVHEEPGNLPGLQGGSPS